MKNLKLIHAFKNITGLLLITSACLLSCKKEKIIPPQLAATELSAKLDGADYKVSESGLSGSLFADAGDAIKAVEINAALDGNGKKLAFFINDLKNGKVILDPKAGTSTLPHPPAAFMQRFQSLKGGVAAGTGAAVQNYIRYELNGSSYYAFSGFIEISYDPTLGKISMTWSISFKDATGRVFTSEGSFTIYLTSLATKSKSEVKDPTPVSAKPTIESISPVSGLAGTEVAIAGTNFSAVATENVVKFNGVTAEVKSATTTKLIVSAPQNGVSGAISLKVKNSDIATGPVFTYLTQPTFTGISPATAAVGERITITGTNFNPTMDQNEVKFTSTKGTLIPGVIKSATSTTLVVEVPPNTATGLVTVTSNTLSAMLTTGFTGIFTLKSTTAVNIGVKGTAYNINALATAIDSEGNIYTYDDNQQLTKRSNDGSIIKTYTKNDFGAGLPPLNSYKVTAMAADKNGKVFFHMSCPTWPNGQVQNYMVSLSADGTFKKEFESTLGSTSFMKMAINSSGAFFILSNYYNSDDVLKLKPDGSFEVYLKGGSDAGNNLDGNGAYDISFGTNDVLFLLTYKKGSNSNAVPTNQIIYKFNPDKVRSTVFSNLNPGYQDGALSQAQFKDIRCIVANNLDLYVGDHGDHRIRKIAAQTNQVTTIAGNGKQYDPANGNQPTYNGPLLSVNIFNIYSIKYDPVNNAIYGGSNQKFVLN